MTFLLSFANNSLIQIFVFGSFFLGLFYFSFYDDGTDLRNEIQGVRSQIQTVQGGVQKTKTEIENVLVFKAGLEKEEELVKALLNYTPEKLLFNEISILLNNEALSSGVNIESRRDGSVDDIPNTEYQALSLDIELTSSFSQLMIFLSKLTQQPRILIVESIDVKIYKTKDLLSTRIKLLAYRYKKPELEAENQDAA